MSSSALGRISTVAGHLAASHPKGLLAGQVAIITGSGQGIGAAAAKLFAKEGALVVVTDIDAVKAESVVNEIKSTNGTAIAVPGDVTDPSYPQKLIQKTIDTFGKVNHIVNNAGFTYDGMMHRMSDKQWEIMLSVHNTAPFRIVRAAAPHMRINSEEPRTIVMVSSTSGLHGNLGQANYATAKAGVTGFTKTLAKEWGAFNVRVNSVAFGLIDTRLTRPKESGEAIEVGGQKVQLGIPTKKTSTGADDKTMGRLIPLGRAGTADEAAASILFLCSPLSTFVTGTTLEVTGGAGI
ncbi:uncharacterized protein SPPG_08294 [Spizellomyces punctatus DAOM BR117]|uniref:Ketoreductase domain-containing protein n=1 Tax=Spizellomyces punctatus (strain DAOM BR117) TaxID=645134 RepID=A0A0L0H4F6_SPIPD|nr:uncharacterized protein SPPG_08294 [Spizellomyces punctatus DAOM BR117]KNC96395.1 hypothetical protein SPPG_08294 [Spizellomyces punctatus DAOM BR117]|eukprot:XP_016604435.1 hypothetical protein SPPG_08294 [Spizellomyces punctatus DAOM BR117]